MDFTFQVYQQTNIEQLPEPVLNYIRSLDIYYQPEYLICDAQMQDGTYELAVCVSGESIWVYPYILLPISETNYFDLSSPYGYAGPATNAGDLHQIAEIELLKYIRSRGDIVTEFVRYHYRYNETLVFQHQINNVLNRRVVICPTRDHDEIWMTEFSGTNRNLVRKLEKEGFNWSVSTFQQEHVAAFDTAYRANMSYTGASDFYLFDLEFYTNLIAHLGDKLLYATVEKDNEVFASALFFVSGDIVTYYLSARNLSYPKVPGSNLLLSKMAFWSQMNGYTILNLGGGLSLNENDHLFKFKSNFGKQIRDFKIGKRIHQPDVYAQLQQKYIAEHSFEQYQNVKHILQFYR